MLTEGKPDDPVWMVIDADVVPDRLVSFDADGLVSVGYSGPYGGPKRQVVPRRTTPASVFPDSEWSAEKGSGYDGRTMTKREIMQAARL